MKRLGAAFEQTKEFGDRLFLAQKSGIDRQLAEIDLAEKAALANFEKLGLAHDALWEKSTNTIKANFADLRAVALKLTGDIERDAELRGVKTREVLNQELAEHRKTLAMMEANSTKFTKAEIARRREIVKAAEIAAGAHENYGGAPLTRRRMRLVKARNAGRSSPNPLMARWGKSPVVWRRHERCEHHAPRPGPAPEGTRPHQQDHRCRQSRD